MTMRWVGLEELPGVNFSLSSAATGTMEGGTIKVTACASDAGFAMTGCDGGGGSAGISGSAHTIELTNTPGCVYSGRHRLVVEAFDLAACVEYITLHFEEREGGWCPFAPPEVAVGTYTYEAEVLPCLAALDGSNSPAVVKIYSLLRIWKQTPVAPFDLQYRIEFEVDYDPPPAPDFWQDFVNAKETPTP